MKINCIWSGNVITGKFENKNLKFHSDVYVKGINIPIIINYDNGVYTCSECKLTDGIMFYDLEVL